MNAFNWIISPIVKMLWDGTIAPILILLDGFDIAFKYIISGVLWDVLFGGKEFNINKIPFGFWAFCIVALSIGLLIWIVQYMTLVFVDDLSYKERFIKSLKSSGLAFLFTIMIPIGFFIMCWMVDYLETVINVVFGGKNGSLSAMIYNMARRDYDPSFVPPAGYLAPSGLTLEQWFMTLLCGAIMIYNCVMIGMAVIEKIFQLYCLFLIGPLFAATMPNDNGVRMKQWRDTAMGKMIIVVGTLLVYDSFMAIALALFKVTGEKWPTLADLPIRVIMMILVLAGGAVYTQTMPAFFGNFVNESIGTKEGRAALTSLVAGKGVMGAAALGLGLGKAAEEKAQKKYGDSDFFKTKENAKKGLGNFAPGAQKAMDSFANSSGSGGETGGGVDDDIFGGTSGYNAKRRTGLFGAIGSTIRTTSSIAALGVTAGAAVGAMFGSQRGKDRFHRSVQNTKVKWQKRTGRTKAAFTANTSTHLKSKDFFKGDKARIQYHRNDLMQAKIANHEVKMNDKTLSAKERAKHKIEYDLKAEKLKGMKAHHKAAEEKRDALQERKDAIARGENPSTVKHHYKEVKKVNDKGRAEKAKEYQAKKEKLDAKFDK